MRSSTLLAFVASLSATSAVYQGFNYGSTQTDGSIKSQTDFENEFKTAQNLVGTSGFTSARLYTMIQGGTADTPTSAIQAAINTKTTLLLGLWASSGQAVFDNEIAALKAAISQHGTDFANLVAGLSIGSEDLYRISPTGLAAPDAAPGADPATLLHFISQAKAAIAGTALSSVKIGHVDTWTAWVNGSNADVIKAVDWIGMDAYPYFQSTMSNGIENNAQLFVDAYDATVAASQGKDVWITETGFPVSGKTSNLAVPSLANAKTYWDQVGCNRLFGKINTWWFTLQDSFPTTPNPSFGVVGSTLSTTPLYDLSCAAVASSSSTGPSSKAPSSTPSSAGSGSGSGSSSAVPTGGLTPGQGNGNGVVSSAVSATTTAPVASSVATISSNSSSTLVTSVGSSGNGTVATGTPKSTSTGPATASSNAAVANTGSLVGAVGAIVAVMAAL